MNSFNPFRDSAEILCESGNLNLKEFKDIRLILEDVNSPVTNKYIEKLYDSVLSKGHIDFDDIPKTQGKIANYKGYQSMVDTLINIQRLASEHKSDSLLRYVSIVQSSISSIDKLSDIFEKGFRLRNEYIMMEYNVYVYTCVQATSTILGEFVDYIKRPDIDTIEVTLKNNTQRANVFYIEQLEKFNNILMKMEYRQYLQALLDKGRDNFVGTETLVGIGAVALVAMAIVPVTRELVYQYYHLKSNLSDCLAQQAYFLEMNKTNVKANSEINTQKKKEILTKQDKLSKFLLRISDKLRVKHALSMDASKRLIKNDNSLLSIDRLKRETDDSKLSLL